MNQLSGLYAITDSHLLTHDTSLLEAVEQTLAAGTQLVQYRNKSASTDTRYRQARALQQLCRQHNARLIINDSPELAHATGADGVHLGQSDGSPAAARVLLGPQAIIGVTCHSNLQLAIKARKAGADYVAFGAMFASLTKPQAKLASLDLITQAKATLSCPIVAIGGISVDNAPQIIQAGADMLAVVQALFAAPDIGQRTRAFYQLFLPSNDSPFN